MGHKAGYVNIIGNPNVGKSTIMNRLVGERISVITSKSQTTRHRIIGIVNGKDFQIIFSDTPGMIKPGYRLQEAMVRSSNSALSDADILLYITDVHETPDKNPDFLAKVQKQDTPLFLLVNKIDLSDQERVLQLINQWKERLPKAEILAVSALHGFNIDHLIDRILELLPENPPYFDKEALTDRPERFFVSEIIRAQILEQYKQEIPYAVEPLVESFQEGDTLIRMQVTIHVERTSQKGILIGHQGQSLKITGTRARKELEQFFGKKVFLELFVKVTPDWRSREDALRRFGYES